jgi:hypothetical protein
MLTMSADQDDRRETGLSGRCQGWDNLCKILVPVPRSPLLLIGVGALMAQYGPTSGTVAPAGAGPPN